MTDPRSMEERFWSKWQSINGFHVTPAYGRAWTEVQKRIYVETPQVLCRQRQDREHRYFLQSWKGPGK
jgi:hypothetical protein